MTIEFILIWMIFMHIVDDYYLQGILAKMKQRSWWEENAPQDMYKNDYIVALIMHSISWAFSIMLPLAIFMKFIIDILFIGLFIANVVIHFIVDDLKANKKKLNLIQDQTIHVAQILLTCLLIVSRLSLVVTS